MDQIMEPVLEPDHLKAARFLDYYKFDIEKIDKMVYDMHMRHPRQHTKEERVQIFTSILNDPDEQNSIKDHIAWGQQNNSETIGARMSEEEVRKQLRKVNYKQDDAIKYWFYYLHPDFTLPQIKQSHDAILDKVTNEKYEKFEAADKLEFCRSAKWALVLYDFDIANHLEEMVEELYNQLFDRFRGNITPSLCRMIIQNVHRESVGKYEVAKHRNMQREHSFKDEQVFRVYRHVQLRNLYNKASPNAASAEEVVKEMLLRYHATHAVEFIRARVAKFFKDYVSPRLRYEKSMEDDANHEGNFTEPAEKNQNDSLESSTASYSGNLNESFESSEEKGEAPSIVIEEVHIPDDRGGSNDNDKPGEKREEEVKCECTCKCKKCGSFGVGPISHLQYEIVADHILLTPPKITMMPPPLSPKRASPSKGYSPSKGSPPTVIVFPPQGRQSPASHRPSAGTSTSTILNTSPTKRSLSPKEMLSSPSSSPTKKWLSPKGMVPTTSSPTRRSLSPRETLSSTRSSPSGRVFQTRMGPTETTRTSVSPTNILPRSPKIDFLVKGTSPANIAVTSPPKTVASPKKIGASPPKGIKRPFKSPTDNEAVHPQPKKTKPIPSDDEDDETQLEKPSKN